MPFPNIPVPPFPNVPIVAGVPAVPRNPINAAAQYGGLGGLPLTLSTAISLAGTIINQSLVALPSPDAAAIWGIFDKSNNLIAAWDSTIGFEFRGEAKISDYPQENGNFASYNKVKVPYDARMRVAKGGDQAGRASFLQAIEQAKESINLFTVVTPEVTYPNASIVHYDYRREHRNGATLLIVDIWMQEVRTTATQKFSNTLNPSGSDTQYGGAVQAVFPSPSQLVQIGTPVTPGTFGNWQSMAKTP